MPYITLDSVVVFFFFKQKTAYEMRISDWSSDVCSSDLHFFAYVSLEHKKTRPFLQGLKASPMSGEIFARGMTDAAARALQRPGLTVHREPQPMDQVLARASMILHPGGNGPCFAAHSAGPPQGLLPTPRTSQESR